jgi:hypothetical protein
MKTAVITVAACLVAVSSASAEVHLTMQNGRVSIIAKDATVRQILTEWARVGQTKIVNVERIPGGPLTLELNNVPESKALEVLLRTMSGYITAPRPVDAANLSSFDRIIIMPTLASARPSTPSTPPPAVFQQPQFTQTPQPGDDDQEDERPAPNGQAPPQNRGPVFNTFPQPQVVNPQTAPSGQPMTVVPPTGAVPQTTPTPPPPVFPGMPTAPYGGVSVPGMVAPAPTPAPGQPGALGQPARRPGGPGGL